MMKRFVLFLLGSSLLMAEDSWRAGVASVRITPEKPMWMAGYAGRTKPSEGVVSDLFAKCTVLEATGGRRLALITLDLIGVTPGLRSSLVKHVKTHGMTSADLVINASHTHCGPELRPGRAPADTVNTLDAAVYHAGLELKVQRLVDGAVNGLRPVSVAYGYARCGFAMNRRTPDGKGGWNNHPYPPGPVDHQVPILRISEGKDELLALWFGYNCHATTLGFQSICADWPGFAQTELEAAFPGVVAQFVNGCSGDQNPYPRGEVELAQAHGKSLSMAVRAALQTNLTAVSPSLNSAFKEIPLAFREVPDAEQVKQRKQSGSHMEKGHAQRLSDVLRERGSLPASYPYPVQVIRLGKELTFVALGGEVVVDYSLRLKRELGPEAIWIAGYSNDVMTYIPSKRVLLEGGYEGVGAMQYTSLTSPWSTEVEEHIVSTVKELHAGF
jgi:neutral ceramidase